MKGKKLTESLVELQAKIRDGDFEGIHEGDYIPVTLANGEVMNMVVDRILPGGYCWVENGDRHIDHIPMASLTGNESYPEMMKQVLVPDKSGFHHIVGKLAFSI